MWMFRLTAVAVSLLVMLPGATLSVAADQRVHEVPTHILVTFYNDLSGKAALQPGPGATRRYRYRSRYLVSAVARRDARAVATSYDLSPIDDWPIESLDVYCVVYELANSQLLPDLIKKIAQDPRVESVQLRHQYSVLTLPANSYNDSFAQLQYALRSMNIAAAQQIASGKGVRIAIVDTGIDLEHEDFAASNIRTHNFAPPDRGTSSMAHGTAVASLIAATPNNGIGIVGVAPAAEIIGLRACWDSGDSAVAQCDSFTLAKALDYAIGRPPDLINLSIAGPYDALLGRLIDKALQNGTIIVAAYPDAAESGAVYPAGFPGVLAVRQARHLDKRALAMREPVNAIFAPGEQVMVALPDNNYDFRSGSSLAAANVSGVIALLLEHAPDLDASRIDEILRSSQPANSRVVDACRALQAINITNTC